ncbi:MAG: hypothetical protein V3R93_01600 [Candidatus Hydrothermarchaeaceae archaeon]
MFSYAPSKINLKKIAVELGEDLTPKSIVGKHMFTPESGIHVDGVLKYPYTYESFMPDEIGASRKIVMGKHAVWDKLNELGVEVDKGKLLEIVDIIKKSSITDEELRQIANEVK